MYGKAGLPVGGGKPAEGEGGEGEGTRGAGGKAQGQTIPQIYNNWGQKAHIRTKNHQSH